MVTTKFVHDGDKVFIFDFDEGLARNKLTPAIYTVCFNPFQGFYLERNKNKFQVTEKTYGSLTHRIDRIIKTYEDRDAGTGVLLTGLKGSGKTLLSQKVSNKMIDKGLPVILIEQPYSNDAFVAFLNKIGECVIIFDEFAKVFENAKNEKDPQNNLLGVFDGNKSSKRLIFVIENQSHRINEFFINRPGRLFYHYEYSRLEESVIDEYCVDRKVADTVKIQIKSSYYKIRQFSFDILKAIVDEHLRYPTDTITDIVDSLNIDTESYYKTVLVFDKVFNKDTKKEHGTHGPIRELEFNEDFYCNITVKEKDITVPTNEDDLDICFERGDLTNINIQGSNIIFEDDKKVVFLVLDYVFEFVKKSKSTFNYLAV